MSTLKLNHPARGNQMKEFQTAGKSESSPYRETTLPNDLRSEMTMIHSHTGKEISTRAYYRGSGRIIPNMREQDVYKFLNHFV